MARRVAVPDRVLGLGGLRAVDYRDSYVVTAPAGFRAGRSADALATLAFDSLPPWLRGLVATAQRRALGLRLALPSPVPVTGWQRLRADPDEAVYGADGDLLTLRVVVAATATSIRVSTLVGFHRPAARPAWAVAAPVHRLVTRIVLDRGLAAARSAAH